MDRNRSFDVLRAMAAYSVVAFHCHLPFAVGGWIGVEVFFVLSGFLITGLLVGEFDRTGGVDVVRFYLRRIRRLWPPLLLMLAVYASAAPFVFPADNAARDVLLAGLYLSDYSVPLWKEPFLLIHTWSLAVEEHFYLVWPLVILMLARLPRRRAFLILTAFWLVATAWRWCDLAIGVDFYRTFYRFDTNLSGLAIGSAGALAPWVIGKGWTWLAGAALLVIAAVAPFYSSITVMTALPVDLLSVVLVAGLAAYPNMLPRHLAYTGEISYSIYLWHYPIVIALKGSATPMLLFVIAGIASWIIAWGSFELVEKPLRSRSARRVMPTA
ncbi:acyltransferase [Mesorhizobium sp. M2A.F.Ca.ET.067.02.1.1]|uniref:acyltransferase family protein n=1 Tax=Mesorhizobium sp. M2A.F.Ca.ET.067.02.1.1 TaxID=2496749 RepID=UPI000FD1FCCC|nr:acyltransferase [Mesorhizobium sp. M2A.F.Ca.ET.067.02.1.1]RUW79629.1 acyltransferase [Mesorhizobium sp. M2A.F.Ca.ET.067.02.1.1]